MGMTVGSWKEAVAVHAGRLGNKRWVISDTAKAAEILTKHWPQHVKKGPKYHAALRACRDVLTGNSTPETAREIFIEAAEEAGILAK